MNIFPIKVECSFKKSLSALDKKHTLKVFCPSHLQLAQYVFLCVYKIYFFMLKYFYFCKALLHHTLPKIL